MKKKSKPHESIYYTTKYTEYYLERLKGKLRQSKSEIIRRAVKNLFDYYFIIDDSDKLDEKPKQEKELTPAQLKRIDKMLEPNPLKSERVIEYKTRASELNKAEEEAVNNGTYTEELSKEIEKKLEELKIEYKDAIDILKKAEREEKRKEVKK